MMLINSYIGRLYNEASKAYEANNPQMAAMISLEIAFLKGRVGTANFVFLGHRYLADITVSEYYSTLEELIVKDNVLNDLRAKGLISFNNIGSFFDYAYPNWRVIDPDNRVLNVRDINSDDKVFERTIIILENELITQFAMGVISLHKLTRLYNSGFDDESSFVAFEETYQSTLKMLQSSKSELIEVNSSLYEAEAHFLKAKSVHFYETQLLIPSKSRALEYYQFALSIKSPRKFIYMMFYLYLKAELALNKFLACIVTIHTYSYLIVVAIVLSLARQAKYRISKTLVRKATKLA